MEQFAYSFIITMLHSIWQMAFLLLIYFMAVGILGSWQPLAKRNLMLLLLAVQLLLSICSFYFIYSAPFLDYKESVQHILQALGSSQSWIQQYSSWIFTAYVFALMYKTAAAIVGWMRFRKICSNNLIKASVEIRNFTNSSAYQFGIKQKVQVWYSHNIQSPIVFGFLKPMILLPIAMVNQLSVCQTEALIIHELTHIKYKDYLYNWLMLFTEAIYFFNPFIKIAIKHIKAEREKNCDVQVLQFNYSHISYAEALLTIAKQKLQPIHVPVAAVSKSNELLSRIRYFSSATSNNKKNTAQAIPLIALMLLGLFFANVFFTGLPITKTQQNYSTVKLRKKFANNIVIGNEMGETISTKAMVEGEKASLADNAIATKEPIDIKKLNDEIEAANAKAEQDAYMQEQVEQEINNTSFDINPLAQSVTLTNIEPIVEKNVVVSEESSNGTSVTRIYRITQVNGEWKTEPLIMVTEQILTDSLKSITKKDSSILHIIPTVQ